MFSQTSYNKQAIRLIIYTKYRKLCNIQVMFYCLSAVSKGVTMNHNFLEIKGI